MKSAWGLVIWALLLMSCGDRRVSKTTPPDSSSPQGQLDQNEAELGEIPGGAERISTNPDIAPILQKVDADEDSGWDSEVNSDLATTKLKKLLASLKVHDFATSPQFKELTKNLKSCTLLSGAAMEEVYQDGGMQILRNEGDSKSAANLVEEFEKIQKQFTEPQELTLSVKTVRVETSPILRTTSLYSISGSGKAGPVQQGGEWICEWDQSEKHEPVLLSITDAGSSLIISQNNSGFIDVTADVFSKAPSFTEQLCRGVDYWRPRLQGDYGIDVNGLQGIALGDANGDGLDDIYVCQQGGLPNRLYLRQEDGRVIDFSAESGLDWMEVTRAALFIDLDNDGDQDMAMAQGWYWVLMENDGTGVFTKREEQRARANLHSLAAADYDLDGDLDIFFCGRNPDREFGKSEGILGQPLPYHDANNGGANILLANLGDWMFQDQTEQSGLEENNRRYSYACSWNDFDLDGDPDLYVANDFGRNNLYVNEKGVFTDRAGNLGVEDMSAGMGVTWGDYNNDGRPDLYVSNMFSSAGNRITYQRQFGKESSPALKAFQRHARGNSLFANNGATFEDVSIPSRTTMARWAWGNKFVDLNNDGWEDLYVANGFITTEDTGDL